MDFEGYGVDLTGAQTYVDHNAQKSFDDIEYYEWKTGNNVFRLTPPTPRPEHHLIAIPYWKHYQIPNPDEDNKTTASVCLTNHVPGIVDPICQAINEMTALGQDMNRQGASVKYRTTCYDRLEDPKGQPLPPKRMIEIPKSLYDWLMTIVLQHKIDPTHPTRGFDVYVTKSIKNSYVNYTGSLAPGAQPSSLHPDMEVVKKAFESVYDIKAINNIPEQGSQKWNIEWLRMTQIAAKMRRGTSPPQQYQQSQNIQQNLPWNTPQQQQQVPWNTQPPPVQNYSPPTLPTQGYAPPPPVPQTVQLNTQPVQQQLPQASIQSTYPSPPLPPPPIIPSQPPVAPSLPFNAPPAPVTILQSGEGKPVCFGWPKVPGPTDSTTFSPEVLQSIKSVVYEGISGGYVEGLPRCMICSYELDCASEVGKKYPLLYPTLHKH